MPMGQSYFWMDPMHPSKLLFFMVGQDGSGPQSDNTRVFTKENPNLTTIFQIRVTDQPTKYNADWILKPGKGERAITLDLSTTGRYAEVPLGTKIFLRGPEYNFALDPAQGVIEPVKGTYHLPVNVSAIYEAVRFGASILTLVVAIALLAAFQSPARIAEANPDLQQILTKLAEIDRDIAKLDKNINDKKGELSGNDASSRDTDLRNRIAQGLSADIDRLTKQRVPLQEQHDKLASTISGLSATLAEISQYIRMFGLGILGAIGGLLGAYAAKRAPQLIEGPDFSGVWQAYSSAASRGS